MDVYLLDRGSRVLLGSVNGLTQATLLLPAGSTGTDGRVQLQPDPIGAVTPSVRRSSWSPWGEGVLDHRRRPRRLLRVGRMK